VLTGDAIIIDRPFTAQHADAGGNLSLGEEVADTLCAIFGPIAEFHHAVFEQREIGNTIAYMEQGLATLPGPSHEARAEFGRLRQGLPDAHLKDGDQVKMAVVNLFHLTKDNVAASAVP